MSAPSTLTITYISTLPSTTSQATVPIVSGAGAGGEADYSMQVRNLVRAGGFWITSATGVLTFIPFAMITNITAQ
jgi:hypothetical protein